MREHAKYECEADIGGRYVILEQVAASYLNRTINIGQKYHCRYCGNKNRKKFRSVAHLFPEFTGNKRIISLDECDVCNQLFQSYDSELAKYLNPFLTMGNVKGKRGTPKIKDTEIRFERRGLNGGVLLHFKNKNFDDHVKYDKTKNQLSFQVPLPRIGFRPRLAYKALVKMGYGLLPRSELKNFTQLRNWLLDPRDLVDFPILETCISYCYDQMWKPIPLTQGTLLKRVDPKDEMPYMLFIFVSGAICFQIELKSDHMNDHSNYIRTGAVNINWRLILGDEEKKQEPLVFEYLNRSVENWTSDKITKPKRFTMNMNIGFDGDVKNYLPPEILRKLK